LKAVMTIEKFVEAVSIDPVYYDSGYYVAPDGDAGRDVYAVLREAIEKTGKTALARVVISQRERTIALRPAGDGLMANTLYEDSDLNKPDELFEGLSGIKTDPEMVQLAAQLVQRQAGEYDPADLEDRYEIRLRAMIDAKLKGEGIEADEVIEPDRTNVVDLMAALKKSLGQPEEKKAAPAKKALVADHKQPALKLPIKGGADEKVAAQATTKPSASGPDPSHLPPSVRRGSGAPAPRGRRCSTRRPRRPSGRSRDRRSRIQGIGNG
jgi:DNA end-binding protein Ku